ncbi:MAG: hypothetical protein J6V44_11730 [Methanobrevibacter sp.]|nr:hypothetical protein [Methanobrevibacter sp.]
MVKGLGGKSKTVTATCSQAAGYYTYGNITINSFGYSTVTSAGGSTSPSISYSQTYGWNGETSGAGTIAGGSNDDSYVTYYVPTTTGLALNTDSGVIT